MAEEFDSFFRSMVETLAIKLDIPIEELTKSPPPVSATSLMRESLMREMQNARQTRHFIWIDPTK